MPPPLHKPPSIKHNVHTDLETTFCYKTAANTRIALIPHPHKFVSAIGAFTTHALNAGGPTAIAHFMAGIDLGQGPLKELDVEELFAALDQACLLETLHLNIAFQTTQALLLCCECLCQFMDHDVAQTGTQLSALCFVNSDTSKSSETAADDSDVDTPEAIPKDDNVSSAIAATLQMN
ncbi:hypothetical protein H0H87_008759 [Tephrocybe sp. NHM501043]|nr:hypothetical protein H0H87_008759 [Tephrocybe sp. NHM501043]